jgi:N-acylglucosamine 2-epimerase
MDIARETIFKCLSYYDKPDFTDGSTPYPGARNLWYWMLLMWFGTCWLKNKPDAELEKLVARCQDAILNYHQNPKFNLMNNYINHDLSRSDDPKHNGLAACGHATEATWMMMYEAVRTKNKKLFDTAAERFKRHAFVSKDEVYDGYYNDCTDVDKNIWELNKVSWAQTFILINSLYIVENTGAEWAKDMFTDQFNWVQEKLPLKKYGFAYWLEPNDRFATFVPHAGRKDIYHHTRHLMLNLASLRRMTERAGKVSRVF